MDNTTPDKNFLNLLSELTERNDHTVVYNLIAGWCFDNCPTWTAAQRVYKASFKMFQDIFSVMIAAHISMGHFPYGELRYKVGQEMDSLIVKCFGEATLDAIDKAC